MPNDRRILDGVRVLDFTRIVAGPWCTRMLADLGASVIKVDRPTSDPKGPVRSAGTVAFNVGKRSIAIELKDSRGVEVAKRLAAESDVLVENFSPGVMERFGLGYRDLEPLNGRLIYASISGFGQTGPSSARRAYGATAQAEAGWLWVQQQTAGADVPFAPGVTVADLATGSFTVSAILAALYDREHTGRGQSIDATLMEGQLSMLTGAAHPAINGSSPEEWKPFRHPIHAVQDGHVNINISGPRDWNRVAEAFGHAGESMPDSIEDANSRIAVWVSDIEMADIARRLESTSAPYGVIKTMHEAVEDPYFTEREMIQELPDPIDGEVKVVGSPFHFSNAGAGPAGPAPLAGQHSRSILESLGYGDDEIDALLTSAVVWQQDKTR